MAHTQITAIALGLALAAAGLAAATPASALTVRYGFAGVGPGTGPHAAYDGEVDQTDANIAAGNFPPGRTSWGPDWQNWAEATAAEYAALTGSDDGYYQSAFTAGWGDNVAHLFELVVAEDPASVTDILLSVEVSRARATDTQYFYLWNYATARYTVIGDIDTGTTDASWSDYSVVDNAASIDATNIGEYLDASGQITLLSINQDSGGILGGARWQRFDSIETAIVFLPEPLTALLLAAGLLGLAVYGRRRDRVSPQP
jgi:hypothetical protein